MPVLGVCFGHQYLADLLGGSVVKSPAKREDGWFLVELTEAGKSDPLFNGFNSSVGFLFSHGDMVVQQPSDAKLLATNSRVPIQAFRRNENVWGTQFHPEIDSEISRSIIMTQDFNDQEKTALLAKLDRPQQGLTLLKNFVEISRSFLQD